MKMKSADSQFVLVNYLADFYMRYAYIHICTRILYNMHTNTMTDVAVLSVIIRRDF